jgi:hypothetical protein
VVIISKEQKFVKDSQSELFGCVGHVPGSATDIAMRNKVRHNEKLINDVSEEFPQLKNIYEILKRRG